MTMSAVPSMPTLEQDAAAVYHTLRQGGVALVPTDVSYGLVAIGDDAVRRIYELKGRPAAKPCVTVVNDDIYRDVALPIDAGIRAWLHEISARTPIAVVSPLDPASRLLGALPPYVFSQATSNGTIATFFSAGRLVTRVAELAFADGRLVVGSSANLSGTGNNSTFAEVEEHIRQTVELALDRGPVRFANTQRLSTTILDLTTSRFLRKGVNVAMIEDAWIAAGHHLRQG